MHACMYSIIYVWMDGGWVVDVCVCVYGFTSVLYI